MASFGPALTEMCIVMMLVMTMAGIFFVTVRSFTPGRFKPPGEDKNDFRIQV